MSDIRSNSEQNQDETVASPQEVTQAPVVSPVGEGHSPNISDGDSTAASVGASVETPTLAGIPLSLNETEWALPPANSEPVSELTVELTADPTPVTNVPGDVTGVKLLPLDPQIPGEGEDLQVSIENDRHARAEMAKMSRRGFLALGVGAAGLVAGWWAVDKSAEIDGIKTPLRRALEFNEKVGRTLFSHTRLAPTFRKEQVRELRENGSFGLDEALDADAWRLTVVGVHGRTEPLELTLADIQALPKFEMITEHKCIEGWSTVVHWGGARLQDFAAKYLPQARNGGEPDVMNRPGDLVGYVSLLTPDEQYYVGLDMESALHPQTMLCYEMNGEPLTEGHGAPLRLVIPVKYGIKAIKRIGKVVYSNERPADYWAERGYDWYAGH